MRCVLLLIVMASTAQAEPPPFETYNYLGLGVGMVQDLDGVTTTQGGVSLTVGRRIHPIVSLELLGTYVSGETIDEERISTWSILARTRLHPTEKGLGKPIYLIGGLGYVSLEGSPRFGAQVGAGLLFRMWARFEMTAEFVYMFAAPGKLGAETVHTSFGVQWRF